MVVVAERTPLSVSGLTCTGLCRSVEVLRKNCCLLRALLSGCAGTIVGTKVALQRHGPAPAATATGQARVDAARV
jgi:hypothetical protein